MPCAFDFSSRASVVVELGVGDRRNASGGTWGDAIWDEALWSGLEPSWLEITADTQSARLEYGRRATTDRFVPGTATVVVDNTSGWADPNTADPVGVLSVRPGRPIRVSIDHTVYGRRVLFRGFVDAMTPVYLPDEPDTVELSCLDALGEINRAKRVSVDPPVGAGDSASTRIERILDAFGWLPRDVSPSAVRVLPTDLGGQAADLLGRTADSGGGVVFGDMAGRVAFRGRDWQTYTSTDPLDGSIGNVAGSGLESLHVTYDGDHLVYDDDHLVYGTLEVGADVCPVAWERPFARADITTRAIMGRDLATAYVEDDAEGIARYGIEPFERTDLLTESDPRIVELARRVLRTRSEETAPRVRSVTFDAATSTAALDLMTTVDVYKPSRYRCRLEYPAPRGLVFDDEYFATGVVHELTPARWTLLLNLDRSEPFRATTGGARWDSGVWDTSLWTEAV